MPLRNEDYVAFLDESGETGLIVVAGVLIPARWLRAAERRWRDFIRDHTGSKSGRTELKSRELLHGEGISFHAQSAMLANGIAAVSARAAGRQLYRDALEHIARTREVRVLAVGLDTRHAVDVYRLWFWMAYGALIERTKTPRPRLAFTIIDGEDAAFRSAHDLVAFRFHRAFASRRAYMRSGRPWFLGGSAHQDSSLHPFVQQADLVAGAARHAIKGRPKHGTWFDTHLRQVARAGGRDVDVSAHALKCLRTLDPKDRRGSGYSGALLPP